MTKYPFLTKDTKSTKEFYKLLKVMEEDGLSIGEVIETIEKLHKAFFESDMRTQIEMSAQFTFPYQLEDIQYHY